MSKYFSFHERKQRVSAPDVRPMVEVDSYRILAIDLACFGPAGGPRTLPLLTPEYLRSLLGSRSTIVQVVRFGMRTMAYMIYRYKNVDIELVRIAVDPTHRRSGLGRLLVRHLLDQSGTNDCRYVSALVPLRDVSACRFLAACGLRPLIPTIEEAYPGTDGIWFVSCRRRDEAECVGK